MKPHELKNRNKIRTKKKGGMKDDKKRKSNKTISQKSKKKGE
jgi:hypothetical protein